MTISQGYNLVVYEEKKRAYNCYKYFSFIIVSHKSLKGGLILSRYSYEFIKITISLSWLHPDLIVTI